MFWQRDVFLWAFMGRYAMYGEPANPDQSRVAQLPLKSSVSVESEMRLSVQPAGRDKSDILERDSACRQFEVSTQDSLVAYHEATSWMAFLISQRRCVTTCNFGSSPGPTSRSSHLPHLTNQMESATIEQLFYAIGRMRNSQWLRRDPPESEYGSRKR